MLYQGSCHCGQIQYTVEGEIQNVLECNCSICTKRGYLLWFVPAQKLVLKTPADALNHYTFNTHQIKHFFCPACGTGTFGQGMNPKTKLPMAAVNIRCLDGIELSQFPRMPFDGRSL